MGSWGYTPFESDDFGDTFDEVVRPVARVAVEMLTKRITKVTQRWDPYDAWTTIGLILWASETGILTGVTVQDSERVRLGGMEIVDRLTNDKQWVDDWRQPATMRKVLKEAAEFMYTVGEGPPTLPMDLKYLFRQRRR